MAAPNTNAPFGLLPIGSLGGEDDISTNRYYIASTDGNAYYVGSPVNIGGGADANGVPACVVCAGTDAILGAIVGIEPVSGGGVSMVGSPLTLEQVSIPATKLRAYYVYVSDDPLCIYAVQGDATATNQTAVKANYNASLTIAAPSVTTNPTSATVISSSTIATTNTLNMKLMGLFQTPGSAFGAYSLYRAKINKHAYADQLVGA